MCVHVYTHMYTWLVYVWYVPVPTTCDPGAYMERGFLQKMCVFISLGIHKSTEHNSRSKKYFVKIKGAPEAPPPPIRQQVVNLT